MRERTNTKSQFELIPEARYGFTVLEKPLKFKAGKTTYRKWKFICQFEDKRTKDIWINFFPWDSKDLLMALGGQIPDGGDDVEWDDDLVAGRQFSADLVHRTYKDRDGNEKIGYDLKNFEEGLPF